METAVKKDDAFPEVVGGHPKELSVQLERPGLRTGTWFYRLTHWETWDWRIKYMLIAPAWLWLCLRARSPWFFTASNPTLTFGGFDGESKREMYEQLPPGTFPKSIYVSPCHSLKWIYDQMKDHGLDFPLALKPDAGKMGLMFRKICSQEGLRNYHQTIGCEYIIQEWISHPIEVSVFYYRMPGNERGTITGFVRKDFLEVIGDGRSTLWELITNYPRAQFRLEEMRRKHADRLNQVLTKGERFCLSPALNLSRGGKLVSLENEKDDQLLRVFDQLSQHAGGFYYGRYDVKCRSIEDLREGKNFSILEYNGSGAEPHHVYGNGNSLWRACSILVAHWNVLYRISEANHRAGLPYWSFLNGWQFLKKAGYHLSKLKALDKEFKLN